MKLARIFSLLSVALAVPFSTSAKADNWGCEVLLCLSNPAGPMAVAQCVPPITRLYQAIFKKDPDPFPTCEEAGNNFAGVEYNNYYDPCPEGTTALASGAYGVQGTASQMQNYNRWLRQQDFSDFATGIGEGAVPFNMNSSSSNRKVCVGSRLGAVTVSRGSGDDMQTYSVDIYDRLAYLDPYRNGFAIKVFMDGKLYRVIRPQL